jgi:hypothetical protein
VFFVRAVDEEDLQKREAIGTIKASRFVRQWADADKPIDIGVVYAIHKLIFGTAWPEIAGVLRTEEASITDSLHLPPHHSHIPGLMLELDQELRKNVGSLTALPVMNDFGVNFNTQEEDMIGNIIQCRCLDSSSDRIYPSLC